jgi:cephalosporin-C deacetylase
MKFINELLNEYQSYNPSLTKKEDFCSFWNEALEGLNKISLNPHLNIVKYPISEMETSLVTYNGAYGTPIKSYFIKPAHVKEKLKCLIIYHGYGGNKGSISQYAKWILQNYAVLAVDCRGMGASGDDTPYSFGSLGTWSTQGILEKKEYYYFKAYLDAKRAIDFVMSRPEIDSDRVCLLGSSLGGGIAMAVSALDHRPKLVVADVPNMCDIELSIQQKCEGSLVHIEKFLSLYPEQINRVFENLTYFDNLNHASNIKSKIRVSVAFKDLICPPMPIFGVYNKISAEKSIEIYPFSGHNAPGTETHLDKTIEYINQNL